MTAGKDDAYTPCVRAWRAITFRMSPHWESVMFCVGRALHSFLKQNINHDKKKLGLRETDGHNYIWKMS